MRASAHCLLAVVALVMGAPLSAQDDPAPRRVVSMNLCTDQLALLVAAPGQLISVSRLAHDPQASVMVDTARALPANSGLAEDIFLLNPDLVVTGRFSNAATREMLRRLGIPVALFEPAASLEDVAANLIQMGEALGREAEAAALVTLYRADLDALHADPEWRPRAAMYAANGYSAGAATLSGQILAVAGFDNVATELGFDWGGFLPLEALVMAAPDLLIYGRPGPGHSRAEEVLAHPALRHLQGTTASATMTDTDWVCGTPHVLRAVAAMVNSRDALEARP